MLFIRLSIPAWSALLLLLAASPLLAAPPDKVLYNPVQSPGGSAGLSFPAYAPDRILFKLSRKAKGVSRIPGGLKYLEAVPGGVTGLPGLDATLRSEGAYILRRAWITPANRMAAEAIGADRWYVAEFPNLSDAENLKERLKALSDIEAAELDYLVFPTAVPADPLHSSHWGHNNTSQFPSWVSGSHTGPLVGTAGFDGRAQAAWDGAQGFGSPSVIIAIIDTGVEVGHPDLDQVAGYDFGDADANPDDDSPIQGHGTACAGVAAAKTNSLGTAGIAAGCRIMPLKVANANGVILLSAVQNALIFAADNGADVISMSFGAYIAGHTATDNALFYAHNSGAVLLAATGNDNYATIAYPANHVEVIAVGAACPCAERKRNNLDPSGLTCDGEGWWGSNFGPVNRDAADAVDVIAPTILPTTDLLGSAGYDPSDYSLWFNGTSCATPYAAGVCALIKSLHPTWMPSAIRNQLVNTANDIVSVESIPCWDRFTGYGMVDAEAAIAGGPTICEPPAITPYCQDFSSGSTAGWGGCTSGPNVVVTIQSNGQGGAGDLYLRTQDTSGASILCPGAQFLGNYSQGCYELSFDMRIISDGGDPANPSYPPVVQLYDGVITANFTFNPSFWISEDAGANPGWHSFTVPIRPAPQGPLPSNAFGSWSVTGGSWDVLLMNVPEIRFRVDMAAYGGELIGYDNICLRTVPCFDCNTPPLAYWAFDEPTFRGFDASGHGLTAIVGSVASTVGRCGHGLRFLPDNNVQELHVPDDDRLDLTGAMTGMAWIRSWGPQSSDNNPSCTQGTIFTKEGNYWFQVERNNNALTLQNDGSGAPGMTLTAPASLPLGEWHHVAFVRGSNGRDVTLYVDGFAIGSKTLDAIAWAGSGPLMFGNYGYQNDPGACEFNGDIDEVRIYDWALSTSDIQEIVLHCPCYQPPPCDGIDSLRINTGFDESTSGVFSVGQTDNQWTITLDPDLQTSEPRPAFVIEKHAAWVGPLTNTKWISSYPSAVDETNGLYRYEYSFCLEDTVGAAMAMSLSADDQASVYLNGALLGSTGPAAFQFATPFSATTPFLAGPNTIRIDVQNTFAVAMGLDISGWVVGHVPQYDYCCSDSSGTILGKFWNDKDANGVRDVGESVLSGWTVSLSNGQTTQTDNLGNYYFTDLVPGTYTITYGPVGPDPWLRTWPQLVSSYTLYLPLGESIANLNFGFRMATRGPRDPGIIGPGKPVEDVYQQSQEPWFELTDRGPDLGREVVVQVGTGSRSGRTTIAVYDLQGRRTAVLFDGELGPSSVHRWSWDGRDQRGRPVGTGIYWIKATVSDFTSIRKVMLMK